MRAESPGTHYPSGGTRPGVSPQASAGTNAPYARTITIYGSVNTNDLLRFLDRTGSRVAGTNVLGALDYYGTNWQARVNALTNGAALGATALQPAATNGWVVGSHAGLLTPPATNTLAAAAAHAATEHGVTQYGGFQGGDGASYATYGGAVGYGAHTTDGGAVGYGAQTTYGGAVGYGASTMDGGAVGSGAQTTYGGAVGFGTYTADGGAVGKSAYTEYGGAVGLNARTSDGFAGGKDAFATTDGNWGSPGIDAIQLGTGGNTEPFSLQIYGNRLLNADGTIPVERFAATLNASNTADRAYADAAIAAIPLPPTNAVAGWLVWDAGSNCYWQVTATNLRFYVWGVAE